MLSRYSTVICKVTQGRVKDGVKWKNGKICYNATSTIIS